MQEKETPAATGDTNALTASALYNENHPEQAGSSSDTASGAAAPIAPEHTPATLPPPPVEKEQPETLRDAVIAMAIDEGCEFYHDRNDCTFVTVPVQGHRENWRLRSEGFKRWLRHRWLERTKQGVGSSVIADVLDTLDAKAAYSALELPVHIRVAHRAAAIYVDLCDEAWRAVEITSSGWRIVNDPPVRFIRPKGMLPLPVPASGGNIQDLRPLINAPDEDTWCLLVAWILAAYSAGPYPILVLCGEQGSSKSFMARVLRHLIDPSEVETTNSPKDSRDVIMAAHNSHIMALDNLSGVPGWLSDLLCSIATGAAHRERKYHTNNGEEELFKAKRPIVVNGIDFGMRDDFLSRAYLVSLPVIADNARRDEKELWQQIHDAAPAILGGIFDILASVLAALPATRLASKPRMADAALWTTAGEAALGWHQGHFMDIYDQNRDQSADLALESNPFGEALLNYMSERQQFEGPWDKLIEDLAGPDKPPRGWPSTGKAVASALKRLSPALRHAGIHWRKHRDNSKRWYEIWTDLSQVSDVSPTPLYEPSGNDRLDEAARDLSANLSPTESTSDGQDDRCDTSDTLPAFIGDFA